MEGPKRQLEFASDGHMVFEYTMVRHRLDSTENNRAGDYTPLVVKATQFILSQEREDEPVQRAIIRIRDGDLAQAFEGSPEVFPKQRAYLVRELFNKDFFRFGGGKLRPPTVSKLTLDHFKREDLEDLPEVSPYSFFVNSRIDINTRRTYRGWTHWYINYRARFWQMDDVPG